MGSAVKVFRYLRQIPFSNKSIDPIHIYQFRYRFNDNDRGILCLIPPIRFGDLFAESSKTCKIPAGCVLLFCRKNATI